MESFTTENSGLERLLDPARIAVIGASGKKGRVGRIVFERLIASRRRLYPVNPNETVIRGYKVFHDIADLPDDIDLAVITVSAENAVAAAEECAVRRIPYIVVVAGGFGETGVRGKQLEERLKSVPSRYDTRVLGPNTLGIFLPDENLDTIFVEHGDKALDRGGTVACIVQSGSVGVEALGYASNTGFGMRAFVGLGNKCDLDEMDFLGHFANDEKTACLSFYLENIGHGRQFLEQAGRVAAKKPVVVLKAGRSETGISAVSSHTGKLAGSDRVVSGAFKQYGIQRAFDDEEFCDASKVLSMLSPPTGNRVAVLTAAGGYGVICTDYIETEERRAKLRMARLSETTRNRIREATFEFAACGNPVDITASADDPMFAKSLQALAADDGVDIIICIAFFAPPGITENLIDHIAGIVKSTEKAVLVFTKYGPFTDTCLKNFYYAGVTGFPSIYRTVRAARFLVERADCIKRVAGMC